MTNTQIFFLFLILSIFQSPLVAQNAQPDRETRQQLRMATNEALRKPDGVHQAAKINGGNLHLSEAYNYGFVLFSTLESLSENSDIAVIGTPLSSENKVIDDGRRITTEYKFRVQEPIQGKIQLDDVITVELPGGKVAFDDGATAQLDITNFPRLESGHHYVLYLESLKSMNAFQPVGGPEGVFELKPNGRVSPFASPQHTEAAAQNDDGGEFIEKVRAAAKFQKAQ